MKKGVSPTKECRGQVCQRLSCGTLTADIQNAFAQTFANKKDRDEQLIMIMRGTLANLVDKEGKRALHVKMLKGLGGMLHPSFCVTRKFQMMWKHWNAVSLYNLCVTNKHSVS